nr:zinc finger, CCHC-type [Tanacetum cinerariifolium]
MSNDKGEADQDEQKFQEERVFLPSLITNMKRKINESKKMNKSLNAANTSLEKEIERYPDMKCVKDFELKKFYIMRSASKVFDEMSKRSNLWLSMRVKNTTYQIQAKDYHRKHRVCYIHSKSLKVIVAGLEHRFYHNVFELDGKNQRCHKQLVDHNARCRKSSLYVVEQCAWALGNVAGGGEELRDLLISQGALRPLGRMMLSDNDSTVQPAAWALLNLIKPEKVLGVKPRADGSAITVLLQDKEVEGLQLLKDDQWVGVPIVRDVLTINVSDQIEVATEDVLLFHYFEPCAVLKGDCTSVAAIIEKLPPSWVDFKNYLKHKRKEISVEDLIVRLRIEEDNKLAQKNTYAPNSAKANMVEHGTRYNCNQPSHRAASCKMPKRVNPRQTNMVNDNMDMIAMVFDIIAMISKVNLVAVDNGEKLCMGNSATANIKGEGDVILKKIKVVRSNRGGEYVSPFAELRAKHGIRHKFIAPYSPQQNDKRQQDDNDLHDERQDQLEKKEVEPQRSKKARTEKSFGPDFVSFMVENKPMYYQEAKMKADGTIDKYKARLVIKGYRQREGLDYFDTYSPVTRITSIRMALVIAALRNFNDKMIKSTKDMLKSKFDIKDMGLADVILGIKIIRSHNRLVLSQAHYVDKILSTHNAGDSYLVRTPIDTSTRPDLAYALSRSSRYTSNPSDAHWKAMTRVLYYLRCSRDYVLHYDSYLAVIEGYNDAYCISDIKDSRLTSGYVFTLGGVAISWKSSKQTVIAKSTMESEFITLDRYGEEAEWLRQFVEDIPRWPKPVTAISKHYDSQSTIGRAHRIMYNGNSKHIHCRHNSIRQLHSTRVILIDYVKSKDNIADLLTIGLSRKLVSKSSKGMGLKPLKE